MTSDVMEVMTSGGHKDGMKKLLPIAALVVFTLFSLACVVRGGTSGLSALLEPWPLQFSVDLYISLFLIGGWMLKDGRERGISALPFVILLPFLGSIVTLAYLVLRSFAPTPTPTRRAVSLAS